MGASHCKHKGTTCKTSIPVIAHVHIEEDAVPLINVPEPTVVPQHTPRGEHHGLQEPEVESPRLPSDDNALRSNRRPVE
jgi:hypothetical protein